MYPDNNDPTTSDPHCPPPQAMSDYRGRLGEDLALNHFINSIVVEENLGNRWYLHMYLIYVQHLL